MVTKHVFAAILLLQAPLWAEAAAADAPAAGPAMNEMTGAVLSISSDPKVIRLTLEGGYNVEFTYDGKTVTRNGGHELAVTELSYGDKVIVRYVGKDLIARQIDRTEKAPVPTGAAPEPPAAPAPSAAPASVETPPTSPQ